MKNGTNAFNSMKYNEDKVFRNLNKEEGSIEQRAESIMSKVEDEIKGHKEAEKYLPKAEEILNENGSSVDIPEEELEKYPGVLDGGKLLAYIKVIEREREENKKSLH